MQLNKCVVMCGSDLQSSAGCLSSSTLFKYVSSRGHLFDLSLAMVGWADLGDVVSE